MMLLVVLGSTLAFLVTFAITPYLIRQMKTHKITGIDVHKVTQPICAEMGGLAVLLGATCAFLCIFLISNLPRVKLLSAFSTIFLAGGVGMIDDIFTLRQRYKVFLTALTAVPLLFVTSGYIGVWFPFVGLISLGLVLQLLIPLGVTTASNLTNMFAGFNGLESGIGAIAMFTLGILSTIQGTWEASLLAFPLCAAYLGFLRYNWYPAEVFPGDTGTLLSGAAIATISIIAGIEAAGAILLAPAGIDFTLKMLSKHPFAHRKIFGDTKVARNGTLTPPPYPALCHVFMRLTPLNEKGLVITLLFMEAIYSTIAILLYHL